MEAIESSPDARPVFAMKRLLLIGLTTFSLSGGMVQGDAVPSPFPPRVAQGAGRTEVDQLLQTAAQHYRKGQFEAALATYQQVVALRRQLGDRPGEGEALYYIGRTLFRLNRLPEALQAYQQALTIRSEANDLEGQGVILNGIARVYTQLNDYRQAVKLYQRALEIRVETNDLLGEAITRNDLGSVYQKLGQYDRALELHQQALKRLGEMGDRPADEANVFNNIGVVYESQGKYRPALEAYQQALTRFEAANQPASASRILTNIGAVYIGLGQFPQAEKALQEALKTVRRLGATTEEATILGNIGVIRERMGQYAKALEAYRQAAAIFEAAGDLPNLATMLNNQGIVYQQLGQYNQALQLYQQTLTVRQQMGDRVGAGATLNNIGTVYRLAKQIPKALEFYQQALKIVQDAGDRSGEGSVLNNLGATVSLKKDYRRAAELYEQALKIRVEVGDRSGQGVTLGNLGSVYHSLKDPTQAQNYYQQSLAVARELGDRQTERVTLSNLATLLQEQGQVELAVAFYKQAVNVTESIRQELRSLSRPEQESYTATVADTYRALAALLLSLQRVAEAQQVMELLKLEEIRTFTRNAGDRDPGLGVSKFEEKILQKHGSVIALGLKVDECKQSKCPQLSQLSDDLQALTQEYLKEVETYKAEIRKRRAQDDAFLDPSKTANLRRIVDAQPGTVLIYPLVLTDRIWLIWAAPGGVLGSKEIPVTAQQLGQTVVQFRNSLQDYNSSPQVLQAKAQQLHEWLVQPLERELVANKVTNLVFALDRITRYIPVAALFDGNQYLVEKYTVSTVLSADLTDTDDRMPIGVENTRVLGLGASKFDQYGELPNVPIELDMIIRKPANDRQGIFPGLEFLDRAFDLRALRDNLSGQQILHIATHGSFVPGKPEDSFLVLGTGDRLTTDKIQSLTDLNNIHLVILSACETALGGPDQDGVEISGISSYFLNGGAAAVMASLWSVDDASTSLLMQAFYSNLAKGTTQAPVTKAAALRDAQLKLLRDKEKNDFSHPFFWAPFVLIGNWL